MLYHRIFMDHLKKKGYLIFMSPLPFYFAVQNICDPIVFSLLSMTMSEFIHYLVMTY